MTAPESIIRGDYLNMGSSTWESSTALAQQTPFCYWTGCRIPTDDRTMDRIYPKEFSLKALRKHIECGIFAVPELQREFVWNARKACDLLDSIYRNYPIGNILVWKTGRQNEGQLRKRLHILPHYNRANRHIYFLLDGQQRLSVLWHFLRGQSASVVNSDGQRLDFGSIYFDPYAADGERLFVYRKRLVGQLADRLVSVVDLLSPGWNHRVRGHGVRAMRRIAGCRRQIHNYRALLVFCETNDLSEVRETFIRINSLGMRIGAADRAFARASRFNLRGLVSEAQTQLKYGFDGTARTTILQMIALVLGSKDLGERAIDSMISRLEREESVRKQFDRAWPKLREALGAAVDFVVHELDVPNFDFLPSEPMMTVLTLFFFHNGKARPSRAARLQLRRWFWATAVGARYTGRGYTLNLLSDIDAVKRLASNPKAKISLKVRIPINALRTIEYSRPGPVSNGFFCLLRKNQPRYLQDGARIPLGDISTRRNRSDKHHIFPRALLNGCGVPYGPTNSILNICYLVARENQSVGRRAPRLYFDDVPRNARARRLCLSSQLIPSKDGCGIWDRSIKRGFRTFLDDRARLLARAFEREAGMRLFERG